MIVKAKQEDLARVKEMWRISFPQEDPVLISISRRSGSRRTAGCPWRVMKLPAHCAAINMP